MPSNDSPARQAQKHAWSGRGRQTVHHFRTGKGRCFSCTKSDAGWRVIAVPQDVVELLRKRLAKSWSRNEAGLSARAIADHLGHARPSRTQDVYMGCGVASAEAANVLGWVM